MKKKGNWAKGITSGWTEVDISTPDSQGNILNKQKLSKKARYTFQNLDSYEFHPTSLGPESGPLVHPVGQGRNRKKTYL